MNGTAAVDENILKPCPCCGKPPAVREETCHWDENLNGCTIECENPDCCASPHVAYGFMPKGDFVATRKNATPSQIALAWLLAQKPWIVPIPGTMQMTHMLENIGASGITFGHDELRELNTTVAAIPIHGERLPPAVLAFSGVEAPLPY